jgi:hypothetical protein
MAVAALSSLGLAVLLFGRWDELSAGLTGAPAFFVVAAIALQVLALIAAELPILTVEAALAALTSYYGRRAHLSSVP